MLVWYGQSSSRLRQAARLRLSNEPEICVSIASLWELAIKHGKGKLRLTGTFESFVTDAIARMNLRILPVELRHVLKLLTLTSHHADPFDRIIASQALVEGLDVVSIDRCFDAYGVPRIW